MTRPNRDIQRYREAHSEYQTWCWLYENSKISQDEFENAYRTLQPVSSVI